MGSYKLENKMWLSKFMEWTPPPHPYVKFKIDNLKPSSLCTLFSSMRHIFLEMTHIYLIGLFKILFDWKINREKVGNSFHFVSLTSLKHHIIIFETMTWHKTYSSINLSHIGLYFRSSSLFLRTTDLFIYHFSC